MNVRIAPVVVGLAATASGVAFARFRQDMERHERRLADRSSVVRTPWGDVEFTHRGSGRRCS